jgi:hypothetical protein
MKNKYIFGTLIFLLLIAVIGCESNTNGNLDSKYKTYSNKEVAFYYPASWEKVDSEKLNIDPVPEINFVNPADGASINLMVTESPVLAPSAEDQVKDAEAMYNAVGKDLGIKEYKKINFSKLKIGKYNAGILTGEMTLSQTDEVMKNKQLIVPIAKNTYTLTLTCDKDKWEQYEPLFNEIIASFKLVNR